MTRESHKDPKNFIFMIVFNDKILHFKIEHIKF